MQRDELKEKPFCLKDGQIDWVENTLKDMSLDEKLGQMICPGVQMIGKKQIEEFIEEHIEKDVLDTEKLSLTSEEDFEKLILAYDLSTRKNSKYKTLEEDAETIEKNGYRYPALKFVRRHL